MKQFTGLELAIYAAGSALYWGLVYIIVRLSLVLACGMGPGALSDCSGRGLAYRVGFIALAIYGLLVWLTIRNANQGDDV